MRISILKPDQLQLVDAEGALYGCNQEWFATPWQRQSGCGPSVASNILLYYHRAGKIKIPIDVQNKADFTVLMETVWKYVTPTDRGLYLLTQLCSGVDSLFQEIGSTLQCLALDIPRQVNRRPAFEVVANFIAAGLAKDAPIAFLNLSSGTIKELDEWHWVTIVALEVDVETKSTIIEIYDNSRSVRINLREWYETTKLGGGFVYFS